MSVYLDTRDVFKKTSFVKTHISTIRWKRAKRDMWGCKRSPIPTIPFYKVVFSKWTNTPVPWKFGDLGHEYSYNDWNPANVRIILHNSKDYTIECRSNAAAKEFYEFLKAQLEETKNPDQ